MQENLDYNVTTSVLAGATGRSLGEDISKLKSFRNAGYKAFSKMYESHVVPVIDYSAGVWGYLKFEEGGQIQNQAIRYYLEVHQKASIVVIEWDMGCIRTKIRDWVAMLRPLE